MSDVDSEIEKRAQEKAVMFRVLDRIDAAEKKLFIHDEIFLTGNGKPAVRETVRENSAGIKRIDAELELLRQKFEKSDEKISEVHSWMEARRDKLAESKKWTDQVKSYVLKNVLSLIQTAAIGLVGYLVATGKM